MKIRTSSMTLVSTNSAPSSSSPLHSSLTHSTTSPANSVSSFHSISPTSFSDCSTRCEGLDLLVKAVHHVAGSTVGVPYIQRRVLIRRRRRKFAPGELILAGFSRKEEDDEGREKAKEEEELNLTVKRKRRMMALPVKYQDSVLQPLKRKNRRQSSAEAFD